MEELYSIIEEKIKASGFTGDISGRDLYDEVSMEADKHENGSYIFMVKVDENVFYEGNMDIHDEEFDLHTIDIHEGDKVYHVDFDA